MCDRDNKLLYIYFIVCIHYIIYIFKCRLTISIKQFSCYERFVCVQAFLLCVVYVYLLYEFPFFLFGVYVDQSHPHSAAQYHYQLYTELVWRW